MTRVIEQIHWCVSFQFPLQGQGSAACIDEMRRPADSRFPGHLQTDEQMQLGDPINNNVGVSQDSSVCCLTACDDGHACRQVGPMHEWAGHAYIHAALMKSCMPIADCNYMHASVASR
jgi:hypothetical protein